MGINFFNVTAVQRKRDYGGNKGSTAWWIRSQIHSPPFLNFCSTQGADLFHYISELLCLPACCGFCPQKSSGGAREKECEVVYVPCASPLKVAPGGFPPLEVTASRKESSPCSPAGFQTHFLPSPLSPRSDTGCAGCCYLRGLPQTLPTYL